MNKKKTILAAVVLLLVFVVGGAIAYFTDTATKTNTFTIGNVDIDLVETAWDALADTNDNDIPDAAEDMMPGEFVTKDPVIRNLSTKNPAYVFAKVEVPCSKTVSTPSLPTTELFTYTVNSAWTELTGEAVACTDSGTATHVYYYGTGGTLTELAKATNDSTPTAAPALFVDNKVTLLGTLSSEQIPNPTAAKNIVVTGYGIQTEGLASTAPATVWGYFA
ncbi:MAG: SipW-dependent-type signal peptide-containing protein [Bacilli bacterium]|nr:SipW-dependent-type signal peptide-containing protein [Bacilli bacterium]